MVVDSAFRTCSLFSGVLSSLICWVILFCTVSTRSFGSSFNRLHTLHKMPVFILSCSAPVIFSVLSRIRLIVIGFSDFSSFAKSTFVVSKNNSSGGAVLMLIVLGFIGCVSNDGM